MKLLRFRNLSGTAFNPGDELARLSKLMPARPTFDILAQMSNPDATHRHISTKASRFEESVIRRMTQVCLAHQGVNLAQGFPDFPTPPELQEAATKAIRDGFNQYARTWGAPQLVDALAAKVKWFQGMEIDPTQQVTICCGTTEAMIASLLATVNPGDEVIVTSPFYENYGADTILCGAIPRYVTLHPTSGGRGSRRADVDPAAQAPSFSFDPDELRAAFNNKTRGIIVNTPNNPTGKVYTREDLQLIADLCQKWDTLAFTDEIYEHILYDGRQHISLATLPGMAERTITISGMSKTYSVTGWRVAWAIASPEITAAIRKVHDFLTVGAPHPLQVAGATALSLPREFYDHLSKDYAHRRDLMWNALKSAGFEGYYPEGAYYIIVNIDRFARPVASAPRGGRHASDAPRGGRPDVASAPRGGRDSAEDDTAFAMRLVKEAGVATVPGSSFYNPASLGHNQIRFCFCKKDETILDVGRRLAEWAKK